MCNRFYKNSFCIQQKGKKKFTSWKQKYGRGCFLSWYWDELLINGFSRHLKSLLWEQEECDWTKAAMWHLIVFSCDDHWLKPDSLLLLPPVSSRHWFANSTAETHWPILYWHYSHLGSQMEGRGPLSGPDSELSRLCLNGVLIVSVFCVVVVFLFFFLLLLFLFVHTVHLPLCLSWHPLTPPTVRLLYQPTTYRKWHVSLDGHPEFGHFQA